MDLLFTLLGGVPTSCVIPRRRAALVTSTRAEGHRCPDDNDLLDEQG